MKTLFKYRRIIIGGLLPVLSVMLFQIPAWAGSDPADNEVKTSEVKWNVQDDVIIINYDLKTDPNMKIKVDITMKRENDPGFRAVPLTVEGAIGEGFFADSNREVRWYYRRDYPQGFVGKGYFFEVRVQEIQKEKESHWIYYAIGAAAVAGGVVALLVGNNQDPVPALSKK